VKPIALTGDPLAQDAAGHRLAELTTARGLALKLFIGVKTAAEAYHVHASGGEVWLCGPYAPARALVGHIDRVLPGITPQEIAPSVLTSLEQMLAKTPINGEAHHDHV
jgi:hypothetical protein